MWRLPAHAATRAAELKGPEATGCAVAPFTAFFMRLAPSWVLVVWRWSRLSLPRISCVEGCSLAFFVCVTMLLMKAYEEVVGEFFR